MIDCLLDLKISISNEKFIKKMKIRPSIISVACFAILNFRFEIFTIKFKSINYINLDMVRKFPDDITYVNFVLLIIQE